MLTSIDVAKYFLALVDEESGDSMSNLKLQKLLYYAQGLHLALFGKPIFEDHIEAWTHGPVVPSVYHSLKVHGSQPVPPPVDIDFSAYPEETRGLLDEVFEVYGQFSPWKLRNMTHEEPPWKDTPQGEIIPRRRLREYFLTRIENEDDEEW